MQAIDSPEWDAAWDELASTQPESGFMQSSAWAAFKRLEGYQTTRLAVFSDTRDTPSPSPLLPFSPSAPNRLLGGATLFYYPSPAEAGFILCPEGPVLPWGDTETARSGLRAIVEAAMRQPGWERAIGLRAEPHLPPPAPSLFRNWSRAPVDLTPIHSLVLELTLSNEELLSGMRPKGRYNIGVARRHGVQVRRSADMADLGGFYALFLETAQRNDFFAEPYGFFLNLGAALFPAGMAELLLATWSGELLGAILLVYYGRRATYLYGGSSGVHRHVMASYALQWAGVQAARERGCVEYDLYGYDPFGLPGHLYEGISRFKRQLGGERRDSMGAHDRIFYDRLAGRLAERLSALPPV